MKELYIDKSVSNVLKFSAAIMVALHHYSQYVISNDLSHNLIYKFFSSQGGYLGVAIFFFLSGYGLMKSEEKKHINFLTFINKRILKVYLPVILSTIIWLPIFYAYIESPEGFFSVLKDLFWDFNDNVFWFIKPLLFLYLTFYIFSELLVRTKRSLAYVFLVSFNIILCYYQLIIADFTMISIPFFIIGVIASDYKYKNWGIFNVSLLYLIFICVGVSFSLNNVELVKHAIFNYIIIALILVLVTKYRLKVHDYPLLGIFSFDIYLVHNKIIILGRAFSPSLSLIAFLTLTTFFVLLFSLMRRNIEQYTLKQ